MPTSRPRYQVTDTGPVSDMLDIAAQRWPDVRDRKALLLQLVETGAAQLRADQERLDAAALRARQVEAARRSLELIEVEYLMSDDAWR